MTCLSYFQNGLVALSSLKKLNPPSGYDLAPVVSQNWKTSEKRLLVIIETVDRHDLSCRELLNNEFDEKAGFYNPMLSILPRLIDRAFKYYASHYPDNKPDFEHAVGFVNFNARRTMFGEENSLTDQQRKSAHLQFANRVLAIIERIKPTHVLCCGFTAAQNIFEILGNEEPKLFLKSGWVFDLTYKDHPFKFTQTLDLEPLYNPKSTANDDDEDEDNGADKFSAADLLYFCIRNTANLFNGKHLYDASAVKPVAKYVNTIVKFRKMMDRIEAAPVIAMDTESRSLQTYDNNIYMIQFAMSSDVGYVLPIEHPQTPFDEDEIKEIKSTLKSFLGRRDNLKELIFLNGSFDMRLYRGQLDIKFIHHKIWETTAGEALLDENIGLFSRLKMFRVDTDSVKISYQNLRNLFTLYNNDYYWTAEFSKEERSLVGSLPPDHPGVQAYAVMDVLSIFRVRELQLYRSEHTMFRPDLVSGPIPYASAYRKHVLNQMGATVVSISHMEQSGSPLDMNYINKLMGKQSPLLKEIKNTELELRTTEATIATEATLEKNLGKQGTLFGGITKMFTLGKKEHQMLLFLSTLGLKPISYTKTKQPSIDKNFIKAYEHDHQEVRLFGQWTKLSKLFGTYVKGWNKKILSTVDSSRDHCLRPSFGFFTIVTGRLNSFDPSLQQVPSRGPAAKVIKRSFVAPRGKLQVKYDYNAAEVRMAAVCAKDKVMASTFKEGAALRKQWIFNPLDSIKLELKKKGDPHIQSVFRFFGIWVDKSHPLREAIKAVIFGLIYGKSYKTLAKDLRNQKIAEIEDLIRKIKKSIDATPTKELKAQYAKLKDELIEAEEKDWESYSKDLQDKLFKDYFKLGEYLTLCADQVEKYYHVASPIGRVRNLYRAMTGKRGIISAARRRGQNAPIQGISSEIGCAAGYLILKESACYLEDNNLSMDYFPDYCRAVHDANYFLAKYEFVIPMMHITAHMATTGAVRWYEENFSIKFNVHPEIELEVSAHEQNSYKWDWSMCNLAENIVNSLIDQVDIDYLDLKDIRKVLKTIYKPWVNQETRDDLQKHYPLLGVVDLNTQMDLGIKHAFDFLETKLATR